MTSNPGHWAISSISVLGDFMRFGFDAFGRMKKIPGRTGLVIKQCEFIGVKSLGILSVASVFLGGVLGYQLYLSLHLFGAEALMGGTVGLSLYRELGPVMAAIMVTGNAGAAMAAEIASMRISEQIDALDVMAVDPMEYLVMPRIVAGTLMLPILAVYFSTLGSMTSQWVATLVMGLDSATYWQQFARVVDAFDLFHCTLKSSVFGLLISWIGCYCGYTVQGGARSVGLATRLTVVATCLAILFSDYLLTSFLPFTRYDFKI
ncbi:MAG: ABC transporter permease [Bdellovibrionales bacterium]|nr:ABC transporter permease [Bdellovibrionales bacterium]